MDEYVQTTPSPPVPPSVVLITLQQVLFLGLLTFLVVLLLLVWCYLAHPRRRHQRASTATVAESSNNGQGRLDPKVLASLPTFVYLYVGHAERVECAVCLAEFKEGELGRLLPRCHHSFHAECIGMWFGSHSTCPLCRLTVASETSDSAV